MNGKQPLLRMISVQVTINQRVAWCPWCREKFAISRVGNAWGQTSKVRGMAAAHARERHPAEVAVICGGQTGGGQDARELRAVRRPHDDSKGRTPGA